ncbi:MAG: FHA domain-containing protein [Solirubrobacterales bacterium]|jgi:predicted component of type VI protein secretion system|nr:FHA domain-containing protein [Solirubrobacterales bacterium]
MSTPDSSLNPHAATPRELHERHQAERGTLPFLLFRDQDGTQVLHPLGAEHSRLSIGRNPANDIALEWDTGVSRLHTELERIGGEWTIGDPGLARNGTWVNEERVRGRQRLHDGDVIRLGGTTLIFRLPDVIDSDPTVTGPLPLRTFSAGQRRVLVELCRPYKDTHMAAPSTNRQIADRLSVSVDAVKSQLRVLFTAFGLDDLPQNQKRALLAIRALETGVVSAQDFTEG